MGNNLGNLVILVLLNSGSVNVLILKEETVTNLPITN